METVKVNAMVDMWISINLDKFLIVPCVDVLDDGNHPCHLQSRKSSDVIS